MEKIKTIDELRAAIKELEVRQEDQVMQLRYQTDIALESLKPVNLIKSVFNTSSEPGNIPGNLLSNSLGLSAGFVAKLVVEGVMRRPLNKLVGTAIMFGIQSLISKNPNTLRTIGTGFFSLLRQRRREKRSELDLNN